MINERSMDVMAGCRPVACPATVPPQRPPTALRPLRGAKSGRSAIAEHGLPHATAGRPTCPTAPGYIILGGYWLVPFGGGASWSAIDVVHGNLAAPDMIRRRRRNPPPQSSSSSLWPAMYSFVRLSMSLVFGLKMHLASAYCTTAMDCYCLPTAPQS